MSVTPDEVNVTLANTVDSLDAALAWIVQRVEANHLIEVCFSARPMWEYGENDEADVLRYEVTVTGKPTPSP